MLHSSVSRLSLSIEPSKNTANLLSCSWASGSFACIFASTRRYRPVICKQNTRSELQDTQTTNMLQEAHNQAPTPFSCIFQRQGLRTVRSTITKRFVCLNHRRKILVWHYALENTTNEDTEEIGMSRQTTTTAKLQTHLNSERHRMACDVHVCPARHSHECKTQVQVAGYIHQPMEKTSVKHEQWCTHKHSKTSSTRAQRTAQRGTHISVKARPSRWGQPSV